MHTRLLALSILLASALPAMSEVTIVGNNGGTIEKSRDCTRGDQMTQCQTDTIFTSASGEVATKTRLRTTVAGASEAEITQTGPEGNTRTRKRLITWGN